MNTLRTVITLSVALIGLTTGCGPRNVAGGDPILPLADAKGSARIFEATEAQTTSAITNAFGDNRYRGMALNPASGYTFPVKDWNPTNGHVLRPLMVSTITNVLLSSGLSAPYSPFFHIRITPENTNQTKVIVRTVSAEVIDGQEMGVHGGWASHTRKVTPVRQEEENVLNAIAEELNKEKPDP